MMPMMSLFDRKLRHMDGLEFAEPPIQHINDICLFINWYLKDADKKSQNKL